METRELSPEEAEGHLWDAVIVGAGAGGATAGFNLAKQGRSVLFIERGKLLHRDPSVKKGVPFNWSGEMEAATNHGWWHRPIYSEDENGNLSAMGLPMGIGAGGSTALFGAVLDRFRPQDFTPRQFFPDATDSSVPEAWPVSYEEMVPFYERAEKLYRVRGTRDPLLAGTFDLIDPPTPSTKETAVFEALQQSGLHPYRIHSVCERLPECQGCPAMICPRPCRNDAARTCFYPALEQHGAKFLSSCRAIRFEERNRVVERLLCEANGRQITLRARVFILAANAYFTPLMLQRSANEHFPEGLGNSSGLVGRNLMFHATNRLFAKLKKGKQGRSFNMNHGVALNDFYVYDGTKLGNVHAHPIATRDAILRFLVQNNIGLHYLPGPLLTMLTSIVSFAYRSWLLFATIIEDLPSSQNSVKAKSGSEDDIVFKYQYPDELRRRASRLSELFKSAVDPSFDVRVLEPLGELNLSHACGTCRFGDDPRTSVLDRDNRVHDLDNLYVLDASFFPSSSGINPSLTIIANSLRASDKIVQRL